MKPRALDLAELPLPALGVLSRARAWRSSLAHWVKVAGVLRASAWRWSLPASARSSWASWASLRLCGGHGSAAPALRLGVHGQLVRPRHEKQS